jgi:hypothetical protein
MLIIPFGDCDRAIFAMEGMVREQGGDMGRARTILLRIV